MTTASGVLSITGTSERLLGRFEWGRLLGSLPFLVVLGVVAGVVGLGVGWLVAVDPETIWAFVRAVVAIATVCMCLGMGVRVASKILFRKQTRALYDYLAEWSRLCAVADSLLVRMKAEVFHKPGRLTPEILDVMSVAENLVYSIKGRIDEVALLCEKRRLRDLERAFALVSKEFTLPDGRQVRAARIRDSFEDIFQSAEVLLLDVKTRTPFSPEPAQHV